MQAVRAPCESQGHTTLGALMFTCQIDLRQLDQENETNLSFFL